MSEDMPVKPDSAGLRVGAAGNEVKVYVGVRTPFLLAAELNLGGQFKKVIIQYLVIGQKL